MSHSDWGRVNSSKQIFNGLKELSCEGHGGMILTEDALKQAPFFAPIRDLITTKYHNRFFEGGHYVFEEDMEAAILIAALPDELIMKARPHVKDHQGCENMREICLKSIKHSFPEFFTAITGHELSIFESQKLMQEMLEHNNSHKEAIYIQCEYKNEYNVPKGSIAFNLSRGRFYFADSKIIGTYILPVERFNTLVTTKSHLGYLPVDDGILDEAKPFTINKNLPINIPEVINADHYYFVRMKRLFETDQVAVLAYNYSKEDWKCFVLDWKLYFKQFPKEFNPNQSDCYQVLEGMEKDLLD